MQRKILFTIAPIALLMGTLVGCNKKEYTVKFDTDGGTSIEDVKVKEGDKVSRPASNPSKDGFTFDDWYISKEGNDKFNFESTINCDITIYAHYSKGDEAKFYSIYKEASDNFQNEKKFYDQYDIEFYISGSKVELDPINFTYSNSEVRECSIVFYDEEEGEVETVIAGGEMAYFDDESKGIKSFIKKIKDSGMSVSYFSDETTRNSGFTCKMDNVTLFYKFNEYGYLVSGGINGIPFEMKFINSAHNQTQEKYTECTSVGGSHIASFTNLAENDLVRVIISDSFVGTGECPFDYVECQGATISEDIEVKKIYLDDKFTEATSDDYTIDDNKITFTKQRDNYTIVDLKVISKSVDSLTISAAITK